MDSRKITATPPVDIFETENKFILVLDMPGTRKEAIEISAEGDTLTVAGKVPETEKEWKPLFSEFQLTDYRREFSIDSKINREKIEASYENGVLTIELEKSENAKPKKIEVKAA